MTRRRKIMSIVETLHVGGDETRLLNLVRALDPLVYEVVVVVMGPGDAGCDHRQGPITPLLEAAGAKVRHLGFGERSFHKSARRDWATLGCAAWAPRLLLELILTIRREKPDVLDLRKHFAIMWGAIAGKLCGVGAIVGTDYYSQALEPPLRRLAARTFGLLDAFISDATCSIEGYRRRLPFMADRTHVIPNGVRRPRPAVDRQAMQNCFGLDLAADTVVFGMVAKLAPFKGHMVLLDAARKVLDARPGRAAFIISGYARSPQYRDEVLSRRLALGLDRAVGLAAYPGPSDDIWVAIDIHVHPSLMDSSPIAIHESMALGLPAVVTAVGGVPDLVEDRMTGLLVPPDDANALAAAMIELLDDTDLARQLGDGARQRYDNNHTPEVMAARTCLLFEAVLSAKGKRRRGKTPPPTDEKQRAYGD